MIDFPKCDRDDLRLADDFIRSGDFEAALKALAPLKALKLTRADRVFAANLYRRLGKATQSLRLLSRVVRPPGRKSSTATLDEKVEYAGALIHLGALDEAEELLTELPRSEADVLLQLSFLSFRRWDYAAPIEWLQTYCRSPKVSAYAKLIGSINLAAALIHEHRLEEAERALREIESMPTSPGQLRLRNNLKELQLQFLVAKKEFAAARKVLQSMATQKAQDLRTLDELYWAKWTWVLDVESRRLAKAKAQKRWREIVAAALRLGDGETRRDLDRLALVHFNQRELLGRLLAGTPHRAYSSWLFKELAKKGMELGPAIRDYSGLFGQEPGPHSGTSRNLLELDLIRGSWNGRALVIHLQSAPLRLFRELFSDFYNAPTIPRLFSRVFPGEHFNLVTSPNRIHQALKVLRTILRDEKIPLKITIEQSQVRLEFLSPLKVKKQIEGLQPLHRAVYLAVEAIGDGEWKMDEFETKLNLSKRQAQRMVAEALRVKLLRPIGQGRRRRYALAN